MYSSTLSLISALDGVGGQRNAPGALKEARHPLNRRLSGPQGRRTGAENLAPTGIQSPDRQTRNESLYRLSYPGPTIKKLLEQTRFGLTISQSVTQ